jgi:hypothetical protein
MSQQQTPETRTQYPRKHQYAFTHHTHARAPHLSHERPHGHVQRKIGRHEDVPSVRAPYCLHLSHQRHCVTRGWLRRHGAAAGAYHARCTLVDAAHPVLVVQRKHLAQQQQQQQAPESVTPPPPPIQIAAERNTCIDAFLDEATMMYWPSEDHSTREIASLAEKSVCSCSTGCGVVGANKITSNKTRMPAVHALLVIISLQLRSCNWAVIEGGAGRTRAP